MSRTAVFGRYTFMIFFRHQHFFPPKISCLCDLLVSLKSTNPCSLCQNSLITPHFKVKLSSPGGLITAGKDTHGTGRKNLRGDPLLRQTELPEVLLKNVKKSPQLAALPEGRTSLRYISFMAQAPFINKVWHQFEQVPAN